MSDKETRLSKAIEPLNCNIALRVVSVMHVR